MKSQIRSFVAITFFAAFLAAIPSMAYADQPQDGQPSQSIICSPDPKEDSLDPKPEDAPFGSGENPDTNDASAASPSQDIQEEDEGSPEESSGGDPALSDGNQSDGSATEPDDATPVQKEPDDGESNESDNSADESKPENNGESSSEKDNGAEGDSKGEADASEPDNPPLEEGAYAILNGSGNGFAVDVVNASTADGTPVTLWQNNWNDWQKYQFQYVGNGEYVIVAAHSGKALTASKDTDAITQQTLTFDASQRWTLIPEGDGRWRIVSALRGLSMDVEGGNAGNSVRVRLYASIEGLAGQLFFFGFVPYHAIDDGTYTIEIRDDDLQVIDVVASSQAAGANVTSYANGNDANQKFTIRQRADGWYEIIATHSGQALDVVNYGTSAGTNVTQWTYTGTDNQLWMLTAADDGWYYIIPKINRNLRLDVEGGHAGNGVNLWLWDPTTNNNGYGQMFRFVRMIEDGYYVIASSANERYVLDVVASSSADGANVTLWEKTYADNQVFHIYQVSGRNYKIVAAHSGKALDVVAGGQLNGTNVTQWSTYETNNQLWHGEVDGSGAVAFLAVCSGLYLDVEGGFAGNSINIQTWQKSNTNDGRGQSFILTRMVWTFDERQRALSSFASSWGISTFGNYTMSQAVASALQSAVDSVRSAGYDLGFVMIDLTTGQGISCNADTRFYSASTVKGPYVASVVDHNPWALDAWSSTIDSILVHSNNASYASLRNAFGSQPIYDWCVKSGVNTDISQSYYTWYSARELAKLWATNYEFFTNGGWAGSSLAPRFGNAQGSVTQYALGGTYTMQSKGGWVTGGINSTCDAAIVYTPSGVYLTAIMSNLPSNQSALVPLVRALEQAHYDMRSQ